MNFIKLIEINERGALTLPKDIRQRLGVARGGTVIAETNEAGEAARNLGNKQPARLDALRELMRERDIIA